MDIVLNQANFTRKIKRKHLVKQSIITQKCNLAYSVGKSHLLILWYMYIHLTIHLPSRWTHTVYCIPPTQLLRCTVIYNCAKVNIFIRQVWYECLLSWSGTKDFCGYEEPQHISTKWIFLCFISKWIFSDYKPLHTWNKPWKIALLSKKLTSIKENWISKTNSEG